MSTKKRARTQAAVVIPSDPILRAHAAAIRELGRQSFEAAVEIGERLIACRKILKAKRTWLAWLKAEFQWSRQHADRFIVLARNREKCSSLSTFKLPVSALFLLAKGPPETIEVVRQRVEAGKRPSVRAVEDILRTNALTQSARANALTEPSRTFTYLPAPESPSPPPEMTIEDMGPTPADVRIFIGDLESIVRKLGAMINHYIGEAALTASDRAAINDYCRDIAEHASTIAQSVERPRLTVVSNDDETKH